MASKHFGQEIGKAPASLFESKTQNSQKNCFFFMCISSYVSNPC